MAASLRFFTEVLDGEVVGEDARGHGQRLRHVFVRVGDTIMGLLEPGDSSSSPLKDYLARPHSGVYAVVWQVDDVAEARKHFESVEAAVEQATLSADGIAIAPASLFGARHEFIPSKDWQFGRGAI
jgi:hypothetical protein